MAADEVDRDLDDGLPIWRTGMDDRYGLFRTWKRSCSAGYCIISRLHIFVKYTTTDVPSNSILLY